MRPTLDNYTAELRTALERAQHAADRAGVAAVTLSHVLVELLATPSVASWLRAAGVDLRDVAAVERRRMESMTSGVESEPALHPDLLGALLHGEDVASRAGSATVGPDAFLRALARGHRLPPRWADAIEAAGAMPSVRAAEAGSADPDGRPRVRVRGPVADFDRTVTVALPGGGFYIFEYAGDLVTPDMREHEIDDAMASLAARFRDNDLRIALSVETTLPFSDVHQRRMDWIRQRLVTEGVCADRIETAIL